MKWIGWFIGLCLAFLVVCIDDPFLSSIAIGTGLSGWGFWLGRNFDEN